MLFNYALIGEIRRQKSILMADFAKLLGIGEPYLSMLENGLRKPTLELIEKLVKVTKIPVEKWLTAEPLSYGKDTSCLSGSDANAVTNMKSRLNREHRERIKAEEQVWELEQANEHLVTEIRLRERYENIVTTDTISKSEKMRKLEKLAAWTMEEGELCFSEILRILKVERHVLLGWLDIKKRPYKCRFLDGGEIFASSPGEAALCLRCFDCEALESSECLGHGDEQRPENIMELLDRLKANGVYDGARQSQILEKYYGVSLSSHEISSIRYRGKKNLPIPDDVLYLDIRKKK